MMIPTLGPKEVLLLSCYFNTMPRNPLKAMGLAPNGQTALATEAPPGDIIPADEGQWSTEGTSF